MRALLSVPITFKFIKNALGLQSVQRDESITISAISNDTRNLSPKDLYVAIHGERYNGEDFIDEAKAKGAYTLSASREDADVYVSDTGLALLIIANSYKKLFNLREVVAITGSVGKSTTKDLAAKILSYKYNIHATEGNLNNEIGVPFTVFGMKRNTEILIIEAGMNHKGELSRISRCLEPTVAVITNIGHAHIGNLGSREAIAHAKLEITDGMKRKFMLIPHGEPLLDPSDTALTISDNSLDADFSLITRDEDDNSVLLEYNSPECHIPSLRLVSYSGHTKKCLAFALALSSILGMRDDEICSAVSEYNKTVTPPSEKIGNITVIDDSYNSSLEAVLLLLDGIKNKTVKHSAVLGDMLELGEFAYELHERIGAEAARANLSKLYTFGQFAEIIKLGAVRAGMSDGCVFANTDISAPEKTAKQILDNSSDETVIFKASNKLKLGRIIDILKKDHQ